MQYLVQVIKRAQNSSIINMNFYWKHSTNDLKKLLNGQLFCNWNHTPRIHQLDEVINLDIRHF